MSGSSQKTTIVVPYVRKNVEARGRLSARRFGSKERSLDILGITTGIPEDKETIKKECYNVGQPELM